ncbi:hypothetical protein [Arthrobacter sp. ov118]|uniref:hypothetical protein n=1 Tax=Arthrobacter sp. ov118 TaxID=1761747 RepID=UPI000B87C787|nr:hypothetical protein [Arthrobacter sp. ov118]
MRQHLIVAQTINSVCRSWPGAPKVGATSGGWLVSGPTGATEAVSTVEALWSLVLRGRPGAWPQDLQHAEDGSGVSAGSNAPGEADTLAIIADMDEVSAEERDLSLRVLQLGQRMTREPGGIR